MILGIKKKKIVKSENGIKMNINSTEIYQNVLTINNTN